MDETVEPAGAERPVSDVCWLVLTPSVDLRGWIEAVHAAAYEAGWVIIHEHDADGVSDGRQRLIITEDSYGAIAARAGPGQIAAIVAEPESSYDAVAEQHGIVWPESAWHASTLLARALSLAPSHRVVTAVELARKPQEILLFDALRVITPVSRAEFPKEPIIAASFRLYRDVAANQQAPIEWSERLFSFCPRASRASPDTGVLDTTGRPRMLVHGPYLSMPIGRWRVSIRFGIDKDAAKHQYRLDWGTRTATISEYVTPQASGLYELALEFDWTEVDAAEVRLILMEGSFTGTLMFQGVTVSRLV